MMSSNMVRSMGAHQPQGDAQQVQDLEQLQREYRHMELNRRAYAEESQQLLRKQQISMDKLRRENDNLKAELAMEFRHFKKPPDSASSDRVTQLQEQAERFVHATDSEKRNIETIVKQAALMKHKILHQRKIMGGVNAAKENEFMVQKQVRILENRLDKALTKFNEVLARNKILRQEIDDLRRERVLFEAIYKKVGKELSDRKKMMADVIELSNINYEQRDNFQLEIAAVEQANRREQDDFQHQMLELGWQLEMELHRGAVGASAPTSSGSAPGFTGADGRSEGRSRSVLTTRSASGPREEDSTRVARLGLRPGILTDLEESSVKARGGKMKVDKTNAQASLKRIQNFEEAFNRIQSATGIEDIEELVRTFVKNEDHNFSLFNYVNEQQNEAEKLEEKLHQLEEEKKKLMQESGSDVHQHKQILKDLEAKLAYALTKNSQDEEFEWLRLNLEEIRDGITSTHTEAAVEKYDVRCSEASQTLGALKNGVHKLFGSVHGGEDLPETVGDGSTTDSNIMTFLGMIEEKTNSLLQEFACAKEREKTGAQFTTALIEGAGERGEGEDYSLTGRALVAAARSASGSGAALATILGRGPQTPMRQELIHVNPPKLEDFSSSDESDGDDGGARPLSRDELKGRTLNNIQRKNARESGARSKGRGGRAK